MHWLDRGLNAIDRVAELFCYALIIVITAITFLQVVLRFVFNSPTSWSEEIALLLLVWFGMIAIAVAIRRHGHMAITAVRDALPPALGASLDWLSQLLILVFSAVLLWNSLDLIELAGVQEMPATGLSRAWLYYPALIGGALMTINSIGNLLLRQLGGNEPEVM